MNQLVQEHSDIFAEVIQPEETERLLVLRVSGLAKDFSDIFHSGDIAGCTHYHEHMGTTGTRSVHEIVNLNAALCTDSRRSNILKSSYLRSRSNKTKFGKKKRLNRTPRSVYENHVLSALPASIQSAPDATQDLAQVDLPQDFCTRKIPEWQTEFMTKYPSLFTDSEMQKWGLECGRGWEGLIRGICNELKGKNVAFTQIKEKYSKLRIYMSKADQETRRYLEGMEEISGKVCENCGRTGNMAVSNGWLFATCEECAKERGREFRWLEDVQKEQSLKETNGYRA
ncbi:hypothetical protein IW261DRAFT_1427853 [Armillaria novae-zelandiae]|uniref:Uncharacterized protein n=1 Tax=Armillaria novae-zelandiae TaxID=153914 RepID=A0AA39ND43_9AGAR|nr:hypothetical protein IW261DRAFT_1427853 [Armillaria novae-zelandiae]